MLFPPVMFHIVFVERGQVTGVDPGKEPVISIMNNTVRDIVKRFAVPWKGAAEIGETMLALRRGDSCS